jgi:hypothetical protein
MKCIGGNSKRVGGWRETEEKLNIDKDRGSVFIDASFPLLQ